jgi:hypothetical protein
MMKQTRIVFLLISFVISEIIAEPYLMFPQHMLPPIGITYNITFNAVVNTIPLSGVYAIQAVTTQDMKTIIGYRMWQGYSGEISEIVYTVSYTNGTGFQASVDPKTQECSDMYPQKINCTGWSNTNILKWKNLCVNLSTEEFKSVARMTVDTDASDSKRPLNLDITITTDGSPYTISANYHFSSQTEGKLFPAVKCG